MSENEAATTTQAIRRKLGETGWIETKIGHFQFIDENGTRVERAIQVGYVLGECWVSIQKIDQRGIDYGSVAIRRGVGDEYVLAIMQIAERLKEGTIFWDVVTK